jgi:mannan endo-1,4-beta-mannosidase
MIALIKWFTYCSAPIATRAGIYPHLCGPGDGEGGCASRRRAGDDYLSPGASGKIKLILASFLWMLSFSSIAQKNYFGIQTESNLIIGPCGDTIIPHGINYAPYDWGYDSTQLLLDQVAQTGANIVRMTWYANSSAPYYTDALLDSAIAKCISNKMIPVIELHDNTCLDNYDSLVSLAHWYVTPSRLNIIQKYSNSLIINVANEAGDVNWNAQPAQAQQDYINAYDSITSLFRSNGIYVPVMIDAPDCGTSIDVFSNVAQQITNADYADNVIFSAHAYWYMYANNDSATMLQKINAALAGNFPLVIGEIANYQDLDTPCTFVLNYQALLHICVASNVGWMAWSWNNDDCFPRQLSTNGNYDSLSAYGNDIVNNPVYGLHTISKLDEYLANNQVACNNTNAIKEIQNKIKPYIIYKQGGCNYFKSFSPGILSICAYDILGQQIISCQVASSQIIQLPNNMGVSLLRVLDGSQVWVSEYWGE